MTNTELATAIALKVKEAGGDTYFVGGCVRDMLLARKPKDIDIEVHRITPDTLKDILDSIGERTEHGKSFGVYGIKGYDLDVAMPRTERSTGNLHTDFEINTDAFLGEREASRRRDFTINALMQNVLTGEIIDYWGGKKDLIQGIIRHIDDERFVEDPLRVLRAARFSVKFDFNVALETIQLCRTIDLSSLSRERVFGEMSTALMETDKPSVFFEQLRNMIQLDVWFPELCACIGTSQNQLYHKEGDVWTHTMMVLDEAARVRDKAEYPLGFMMSALCHDYGKPVCTSVDDKGIVHSYQHETEGIPVAEQFLNRLTTEVRLKEYVLNMVELHQQPNQKAENGSKVKSTNKMFDASVSPDDLVLLSRCDNLGRIPALDNNKDFLEDRLTAYKVTMSKPFVQGRDLIQAGLKPDKNFSELLAHAHKLRLAGVDKESALRQTLSMARKKTRQTERE